MESMDRNQANKRLANPKIHALTSARFFAALYVVLFHTKWGVSRDSALDRILDLGNFAPHFFFLLSGYILSIVYLQRSKDVPKRKFFVARFARIYPLYIASVLADAPFAVLARIGRYGLKVAIERVLLLMTASTFMMQMFLPTLTIINIPSWSLGIEAVFYISFPFLGPWLWKSGERTIAAAAIFLYATSVLLSWAIASKRTVDVRGFDLISFIAIFALGILLARWHALGTSSTNSNRVILNNDSGPIGWIVLLATFVFAMVVAWANPWLVRVGINSGFVLTPVYMSIVWILAETRILPVRLLEAKWLVVLGEASYGLYLIQLPILHLFERSHLSGTLWNYPLYLGTCITLSVLSFYYFETPTRKWILSRFHTLPKESMEAASDAQ